MEYTGTESKAKKSLKTERSNFVCKSEILS